MMKNRVSQKIQYFSIILFMIIFGNFMTKVQKEGPRKKINIKIGLYDKPQKNTRE